MNGTCVSIRFWYKHRLLNRVEVMTNTPWTLHGLETQTLLELDDSRFKFVGLLLFVTSWYKIMTIAMALPV